MSLQAASLYANVSVAGAGQSVRELNAVSGAVDRAGAKFSVLGIKAQGYSKGIRQVAGGIVKLGEVAAAGFVVATAASAHFASEFQSNMELIHTQAGDTQKAVDDLTVGVQNLVHEVGTNPVDLAKGLYHIESVGVRGAASLDILRASAIGAKVGLADMESVTNALTAVWFSGIQGAKSMTDAMAILDGIVGVGNMHLQDLTDSFKSGILGTAATFGVDIRSLGAAMATLTDAGVPANIAATRLNMTLSHMAAPVPKAIDTLKKLGIGQYDLAKDLRKPDGLFEALKDLHDHLAKAGEIKNGKLTPQGADDMTKIFGGSRFGATAMQLLTAMDRIPGKYDLITERSKTFGDNVKATMATASFHWGQFIADVENDAISFGTGVLPGLISGLDKLDKFVVAHRQDAVTLGQDVGKAIDKIGTAIENIDWTRFQQGFEVVKQVATLALDVLKQVPPEAAVAFAGLVGIDKLSGGLLGKGAGNIVGTALGQFLGRGSPMNPMWVQTVGGFGGVGGAAGGGSLIGRAAGMIGKVFLVGMAADVAYQLWQIKSQQTEENHAAEAGLSAQTDAYVGNASQAQIQASLAGIEGYVRDLESTWTPASIAYAFNIDGVRDSVERQMAILQREEDYLARASAEGWGVQRTQDADSYDAIERLRTEIANANQVTQSDDAIYGASAKARGIKRPTKPSTSLEGRFAFLAGGHKGSSDVAVANSLARLFTRSSNPLYTSDKNLRDAIKVLERDQRTVGPKMARAIGRDIEKMKAELARRHEKAVEAAAAKDALATKLAGQATTQAVKDKDLSATVTVQPATTIIKMNGKEIARATVGWGGTSSTGYVRNV